jgi:hypothetical protein
MSPSGGNSKISSSAYIITTEGFKGRNVRVNLEFQGSTGYYAINENPSSYAITVDGQTIFSKTTYQSDNVVAEFIPSILDRDKWDVTVGGIIIKENMTLTEGKIGFSSSSNQGLTVRDFRWKPLFNCEVENDEATVVVEFAPGNTFNIEDLQNSAAPPVKFCLDSLPAVVRSTTSQGIATDIKGEITRKLARGKNITVNSDETIRMSYITDFKEGIKQCKVGQVWNLNIGGCEDFIKTATDTNNIINEVEIIIPGLNQTIIKTAGAFGDGDITFDDADYRCFVEFYEQNFQAPNPRSDCWTSTVQAPEQSYTQIVHNTVLQPSPYYTIKNIITAKWDSDLENCEKDDFDKIPDLSDEYGCVNGKGSFLFTWIDHTAIQAENIDQPWEIVHKAEKCAKIKIINNFAVNFNAQQAGLQVTQTQDLIFGQKRYDIPTAFHTGSQEICIPIDTQMLGEVKYEIIPYIKVGGTHSGYSSTRMLDDQKITYTFFVEGLGISTPESQNTELSVTEIINKVREPTNFWLIISIIAAIIIIALAIWIYSIYR